MAASPAWARLPVTLAFQTGARAGEVVAARRGPLRGSPRRHAGARHISPPLQLCYIVCYIVRR